MTADHGMDAMGCIRDRARPVTALSRFALTLAAFVVPAVARAEDKYALVVGVDRYRESELSSLDFADDDAIRLGEALSQLGFDVVTMTSRDERVSLHPDAPEDILQSLERRLKFLDREDTVVVSLSGHGVQLIGDQVGADGSRETWFCPAKARLDDRSTLLPISEVLRRMAACGAARKLLLVDACRNDMKAPGTGKAREVIEVELDPAAPARRLIPDGMVALFSCSPRERSFERKELGHSVFSYHVIEYLAGAADEANRWYDGGEATLTELVAYAQKRTARSAEDLGVDQTPEMVGRMTDWSFGRVVAKPVGGAIDQGHSVPGRARAAAKLREEGIAAEHGVGRPVDHVLADRLFREAAEAGDPVACVYLGNKHAFGGGAVQAAQWAASDRWFERGFSGVKHLAESGDVAGLVAYADLLRRGRECARDEKAAIDMLRRAAQQDYVPGIVDLADTLIKREPGPADWEQIVNMLEKASTIGSPFADVILGDLYLRGEGTPQDVPRAVACYERAIRMRLDQACARLATLLRQGAPSVPKDEQRAFGLLMEAYKISPNCQCNHAWVIAMCYLTGSGVSKDERKAMAFLELASAVHPTAQRAAGLLFRNGDKVPRDEAKARKLFEKSFGGFREQADRGDDRANLAVAWHFGTGLGVARDTAAARQWLGKAALSSSPAVAREAQQSLIALEKTAEK